MSIAEGSKVWTLQGDIDRNQHAGRVGVVNGFTQLSSYHPREVWVEFEPYKGAWFWLSSVVLADEAIELPTPKFLSSEYIGSFA